ncbi:hypothetical protein [Enterocloster citroniae]
MKNPKWVVDFKITLYALKEYTGWTDVELGKRLDVTDRTIMNMRHG